MSTKPAAIAVLVGLPGSGKSTFAKHLAHALKDTQIKAIIVEYDHLIPIEKQRQFMLEADQQSWKSERKAIVEKVSDFLKSKPVYEFQEINRQAEQVLVIIDDNNYYSSMRYDYYQVAREIQLGFCQFFLNPPIEKCKERNKAREIQIPNEVIDKMASKMEPPEPSKNSWEMFSFQVQDLEANKDLILNMIDIALKNPVKPLEDSVSEETRDKDRMNCSASVIHQADKYLRKMVSSRIKQAQFDLKEDPNSKEKLKAEAAKFNGVKDELLEDFKTGFTKLPTKVIKGMADPASNAKDDLQRIIDEMFDLKLK